MKITIAIMALGAVLGGCADGGSSGTGITTARGNVSSVTSALRSRSGAVEGIQVTIENTPLSSDTDAAGLFSLGGNFAGPVGMLFALPDGSVARLVVTVPRGGALALTDVSVDGANGQASAAVQSVQFDGLVRTTTCAEQLAVMVSRRTPNDGNTYPVRLGAATVRDPSGNVLRCESLSAGDAVDVRGEVRREGEVEAESVDVEGHSNGGPGGGGGDDGSNSGPGSGESGGGENEGPGSSGSGSGSSGDGGLDDGGVSGGGKSGPG